MIAPATATAYGRLEARFRRLGALDEAAAVLGWDHATMMPTGGAEARSEQLATLKLVCHEILTDAALDDLFGAAEGQNDLDAWQRANLAEMRRDWRHATATPTDLVEASSKAASTCEMVWREARPANDFARVLPHLEEVLRLTREVGAAKAAALGRSLYDALLDGYEPDGSAAVIDPLFDDLAAFLPGCIATALERQAAAPPPLALAGPFPVEAQRKVGQKLMAALGFDFEHGRLDVSAHPFCGGTPDDVRITTRYDEADFGRALMGVLHETGHALYERGLPVAWRRQPVGRARGMSVHESQSLLIEMQVCRSREFLEFAAPILRDAFGGGSGGGGSGPTWDADNLYRANTRVARSLIRVDADEVTYPAHVILRYRLEQAMISGDLAPRDLPGAWREGMLALVGTAPPDDADGCLQDIHWYCGLWGYFPTYTLGAMTAAQLFQAACQAVPDLRPGIARGNFAPLLDWLRRHVHGRASSISATQLLTEATGRPLDAAVFRGHLERRYLGA
ncbi:MAG TPA: carboxypeptidase M32 [Stellaceae bacterium]|nr:carboxypeptidase M32 [Stellaceae bacterium]